MGKTEPTSAQHGRGLLLVASLAGHMHSQRPGGAIAGRLTDLRSHPLAGVTVTPPNAASVQQVRTISGRAASIGSATSRPENTSFQLGTGTVAGVQVLLGHELRAQTAVAVTVEESSTPAQTVPRLPGEYRIGVHIECD